MPGMKKRNGMMMDKVGMMRGGGMTKMRGGGMAKKKNVKKKTKKKTKKKNKKIRWIRNSEQTCLI